MVEKASLRPASTREEYQTIRWKCWHRRRLALVMLLPRRSPPSPACRSVTALHTCRVTGRLLTGRTDNDDACHNLVPERRAYPRSPHSRQTPTPHSTPRPHQSEHTHAGKPHRRAAPPPRRERLGAATDRRSRCEHDRIAFVQCKQTYGNEHLRVGTRLRPGLGLRAGQGPARPDLERPAARSVGLSGLGA